MASTLLEKLEGIRTRFDEVADLIIQPEVIADQKRYVELGRQYKQLEKIVGAYKKYKKLLSDIEEAREIIKDGSDAEMTEMARAELEEAEPQVAPLEEEIKVMLIPRDPADAKNAVVELRGGTGGDEAAIFAGDLYRMYTKFAESKGWRQEIIDFNEGTSGGYKEIIFKLSGEDVYGTMKFEAGVHRVQRVPATETQGRVHTSAATCIVMPEAEEFDIYIDPKDIRKDTFCSSGAGGQSVNTTYSAVRLTHGYSSPMSGRTLADKKPRKVHDRTPLPPLRDRIPETPRRRSLKAQIHGIHRRPFRQNTDVQLPAGTRDRPPHRAHSIQSLRHYQRRHTAHNRRTDDSRKRGKTQGRRIITVLSPFVKPRKRSKYDATATKS